MTSLNCCFQLKIWITCLMFKLITCSGKFDRVAKGKKPDTSIGLSKVVQYIVDEKLRSSNRRSINPVSLDKAKNLYKLMKKKEEPKKILRAQEAHQDLVEKELKMALTVKKSALHDRPYIEKKGKNDFLVIHPEVIDPFVTVVPNHIYYNIEKSCVNWLDDCSLIGLRERLLKGSRT